VWREGSLTAAYGGGSILLQMLRSVRLIAVQLALAAMMLRALLPMGWMPNPDGFAQSPLVICLMDMPSGMDMSAMKDMAGMDMSKPGHDHGQQQSNETCPFAAAPHVGAPLGLIAELSPPSQLARLAEKPVAETAISADPAHQPQSPRAPPQIA
jgi:hypothetical protein